MQVICTHEQADLDALAAMLGASLLFKDTPAILPGRLNRNAQAFLNLYGSEFPFYEADDLPHEPIDSVILVDTQSLVSLKGLKKEASVAVFDHHPMRSNLPGAWEFAIEPVGACTTILVEKLTAAGSQLSEMQATLLLLGIYEDTGSLTYSNTTVRDVNAVSCLLEQHANLKLVSEFLNPPLSNAQRKVYDDLISDAETLQIEGQTIVIARARALTLDDEVSSIAHKIRDLLDPDGLFLIIRSNEGLRIVARSTSDHVNAARIMGSFDGGGHERAASALLKIKDTSNDDEKFITEVKTRLIEILKKEIQPAIRVSAIMSPKPHTIGPSTTASEAAALMQRYGYEGFPVVETNKIIGLLTRRAVDRAVMHKMNMKASSLMEAGEIHALATDSVETVQRLMTESGWGQIPVLDGNGKITGIVTRTDLLKVLASKPSTRSPSPNMANELEKSFPPIRLTLLKTITSEAGKLNMPVYLVGGFVRDLLLGLPSTDFDLVVEGNAIKLAHNLAARYGGKVVSHDRFGTAQWKLTPEVRAKLPAIENPDFTLTDNLPDTIDLVSARMEYYERPTALPTVEHGSIKMDLHRRDFTINTLAMRLDGMHYGEIVDHWGGVDDLRAGLIRVLHPLSFIDDPTRMLRAIRFEIRFGFHLEERTSQLLIDAQPLLEQVSGSRIRHELDLIFGEKELIKVLQRAHDLKLLAGIHPELLWNDTIAEKITRIQRAEPQPDWDLPEKIGIFSRRSYLAFLAWLGDHPIEKANKVANRFRFPGEFLKDLRAYCGLAGEADKLTALKSSAIAHKLEKVPLLVIYTLAIVSDSPALRKTFDQFNKVWRNVKIHTSGEDLKKLDVARGPTFRHILEGLKNAWLDGMIHSETEEKKLLLHLVELERAKHDPKSQG